MAPLYEVCKPLDVRTADVGVHTAYLNVAVAQLRGHLGRNRTAVAHLPDENVEAHLRASSRYPHARANNASSVQLFTDMAALCFVILKCGGRGRSHPSGLLCKAEIIYCPCMADIADNCDVEYKAALGIALNVPLFRVVEDERGRCTVNIPLPTLVHKNGRLARTKSRNVAKQASPSSTKEVLRRALKKEQDTIIMCVCGEMTGELPNGVAQEATNAFHKRKESAAINEAKNVTSIFRAEVHHTQQDLSAASRAAGAGQTARAVTPMRAARGTAASKNGSVSAPDPVGIVAALSGLGATASLAAARGADMMDTDVDSEI